MHPVAPPCNPLSYDRRKQHLRFSPARIPHHRQGASYACTASRRLGCNGATALNVSHAHTVKQTAPDWVQAPQGTLYTTPDAAQPQAHAAVPQYPVAPPPPPPPAPAAAPSGGLPWYVWVGVGIFAANIGAKVRGNVHLVAFQTMPQLLQFANPQKVQEMAMQQMMKQMMSQAGMKPPAGGARCASSSTPSRADHHTPHSPFGFPPGGFPPPAGGAGAAANPFAGMPMAGFPGMSPQPTVDVTGTASTVTTSTTAAPSASTTTPPPSSSPPKAESAPASAAASSFFADVGATLSELLLAVVVFMYPCVRITSQLFMCVYVSQANCVCQETEDTAATTAPGANFFEQQAAAAAGQAAPQAGEDPAAAEERANAMLARYARLA